MLTANLFQCGDTARDKVGISVDVELVVPDSRVEQGLRPSANNEECEKNHRRHVKSLNEQKISFVRQ